MSNQPAISIGDQVVYPAHGVGTVTGEENQSVAGHELKMYVISFDKEKMVLRVPVNRSSAVGLRPLSNAKTVDSAFETLKSRPRQGRGMWSRRAQEYETKINSGDIIAIAQVIRDLHKNVDDPDRSYSERVIYESALERLAGEYAAVKSIGESEATELLEDVLKAKRVAIQKAEIAANEDADSGVMSNIDAAA